MLCFLPFGFGNRRKISSASSASERCCSWLVQCTTMMYPIILEPVRPYSMVVDRPLLTHINPYFWASGYIRGVDDSCTSINHIIAFHFDLSHIFILLVTHSHKSSQSSWKRFLKFLKPTMGLKSDDCWWGLPQSQAVQAQPLPSLQLVMLVPPGRQKWCQDGCSQLHFTSNQYRQFSVFGLRVRRLWGSLGLGYVKLLSGSLWT